MKLRTLIAAAAVASAVAIPTVDLAAQASYPYGPSISELPVWVGRYCAYEGSNNCFYDAGSTGHSYIVRAVPNSGGLVCIFYSEPAYATAHDRCRVE